MPDALRGRLRVRRPSLPGWLDRVEVRNLRIAGSSVDLPFERTASGGPIALADARVEGDVDVVLEIAGLPDTEQRRLLIEERGTPAPVVLERPARADGPRLDAVGQSGPARARRPA